MNHLMYETARRAHAELIAEARRARLAAQVKRANHGERPRLRTLSSLLARGVRRLGWWLAHQRGEGSEA